MAAARVHGTRKGCHYYTTLGRPLTVYSSRSPMYRGTRACPCHARHLRSLHAKKVPRPGARYGYLHATLYATMATVLIIGIIRGIQDTWKMLFLAAAHWV